MTPAEAMRVLGLDKAMPDLTSDIVQEAFRRMVKMSHPDTGGESKESISSVQELTTAKKTLLESLYGTNLCCRLCRGRGIVRSGMGFRHCVACNGTGEKR